MPIDLNLKRFWQENAASTGKPFRTDKPRAPISLSVDDHWLIEEMALPSTVRYYHDPAYRADINRRCNDRCEAAIGRRPFDQAIAGKPPLRIEQVFGSRIEVTEGGTPWLEPGVKSIEELRDLLARLEAMNDAQLRELILAGASPITKRPVDSQGRKQTTTPWCRGPATIATSVIGTTEYLYWLGDYPADMERFYEVLADVLIRYQRIIADEQNVEIRGFAWLDDNCCLLSPGLYEHFCLPLMKKVFAAFAPRPEDWRFQHSDSAMSHLLPLLSQLDFSGVNFGPTIPAGVIRRHMPRAEIHGQIAPMTLRNRPLDDVVAEVKRDFASVGGDGGLLITTAGSISAGTSLEAIRGFMWAVDQFARYDGQ